MQASAFSTPSTSTCGGTVSSSTSTASRSTRQPPTTTTAEMAMEMSGSTQCQPVKAITPAPTSTPTLESTSPSTWRNALRVFSEWPEWRNPIASRFAPRPMVATSAIGPRSTWVGCFSRSSASTTMKTVMARRRTPFTSALRISSRT